MNTLIIIILCIIFLPVLLTLFGFALDLLNSGYESLTTKN